MNDPSRTPSVASLNTREAKRIAKPFANKIGIWQRKVAHLKQTMDAPYSDSDTREMAALQLRAIREEVEAGAAQLRHLAGELAAVGAAQNSLAAMMQMLERLEGV